LNTKDHQEENITEDVEVNGKNSMIGIIKTPSPDVQQLQNESENGKGYKKQLWELMNKIVEHIFPEYIAITIIFFLNDDFPILDPFLQPVIPILFRQRSLGRIILCNTVIRD
jgi:hypothetical protein